jgi:hypothetical protein
VLGPIQVIVGITLHRRGPDELPSSPYFLLLMLGASSCVQLVTLRIATVADQAAVLMLLATVVDFAFFWAVLAVFGRSRRFRQTMSALLGANIVTNGVSAALMVWDQTLGAPPETATIPGVLILLVAVWAIDVAAFVLSRALERPYALGVLIVLAYVFLYYGARNALFPPIA